MSMTEKIDALDLIINVLRDHEKKLDENIARLEVLIKTSQDVIERDLIRRFHEPLGGKD